jgi:hypothetical protein
VANDSITITINNWTEFQPRKDLKELSWFRLETGIFDGQTYFKLKNDGLILFIFLLSLAAKKNNPVIDLDLEFVSEKIKFKKSEILSLLEILKEKQLVHSSVQIRTDSCLHNITNNTNITEQDNTQQASDSLQIVVDLWNSFSQLPKVKALTDSRKKKIKSRLSEPAFDYQKAIPMILESDFLLGRTGNWKASFDWFIENETNYLKVLEGNYSKKSGQAKPSQGQNAFDVAKAQIDAINRGEL